MHLTGLFIDGFGIYHNLYLDGLPPGLVLFCGANESGKTSLLEFIRLVLFGPVRKGSRNPYPPLRGGNHGGRLMVMTAAGQPVVVERVAKRLRLFAPDGASLAGEPTTLLLGGLDRHTFETIFAIGLTDLQKLDVLDSESVRARIIAAGAGLGAASLPAALATLTQEAEGLLKKGGRVQTIPRLRQELLEIDREISRRRDLAPEYARARQRLAHLEAQVHRQQHELATLRRQRQHLLLLAQAREPWLRLGQAAAKVQLLAAAQDFPPGSLARWEELDQHRRTLEVSAADQQQALDNLQDLLIRLPAPPPVLQQEAAVATLREERARLAQALSDLPRLQAALAQAQQDFHLRLGELGPQWDAARLADLDTSLPVRQYVQGVSRQLGQAERAREAATAALDLARQAAAASVQTRDQAQAHLDALPRPPVAAAALEEQQQAIPRLRRLLWDREVHTGRLAAQRAAAADLEARQQALNGPPEASTAPLPRWPALVLGLGALGAAGYCLWQRTYLTALSFLFGGIIGVAFVLYDRRRWRQAEVRRQAHRAAELAALIQARQALQPELDRLQEMQQSLHEELERLAHAAGLPLPADLGALDEAAAQVEQAAATWRAWQAAADRLAAATEAERLAAGQQENAVQVLAQATAGLATHREQWQTWLHERYLPGDIEPEGFEVLLQVVERGRTAQGQVASLQADLHRQEKYLAAARARLGEVLTASGRSPQGDEPGLEDLDGLVRALAAAQQVEAQRQALLRDADALSRERDALAARLQTAAAEQAKLLKQAGAATEDELRTRAALYEEWRQWQAVVDRETIALTALAGSPEAAARLAEELAASDTAALIAAQEDLEAQLHALETSVAQAHQEIGDLKNRLTALAANDELGRLLLQQRTLTQQLNDAARRWAALIICRYLLDEARRVYEAERQPQVIQEANGFLAAMTQRPYRLLAEAETGQITLVDASQGRRTELDWSAGLADQVYLAVRLGLARQFGRHGEPLPVILDDVLVKFDPHRQRGAARALLEFARSQQVLLFTSHPRVQNRLLEAHRQLPGPPVPLACYTLDSGRVTPTPV